MKSLLTVCSIFLLALAGLAAAAPAAPALPGDSVYRLELKLVDQDGKPNVLASQRGKVRLVAMFYANCPYVCPMIIDTLKRTEQKLSLEQRNALGVTLFSMDPERDTPEALRQVIVTRKLDPARWTLEQPRVEDVRKLASVLGVQYRQLENRDFNHSSALILLDANGRVLARSSKVGEPDPQFVDAVRAALTK